MPDSGESFDLLSPERTHPIIYTLLANKMTTRSELRVLTIDEVLDLYEVCITLMSVPIICGISMRSKRTIVMNISSAAITTKIKSWAEAQNERQLHKRNTDISHYQ